MANLNLKSGKHVFVNTQNAPGTFQKNGQTIVVTEYAAVDALVNGGWTRTAD